METQEYQDYLNPVTQGEKEKSYIEIRDQIYSILHITKERLFDKDQSEQDRIDLYNLLDLAL